MERDRDSLRQSSHSSHSVASAPFSRLMAAGTQSALILARCRPWFLGECSR